MLISGKVSLFGSSQVQLLEQEYGLKVQIMTCGDAIRDTTDTDKMNFINPSNNNLEGMLYESSAFVSGLVPYGDIP